MPHDCKGNELKVGDIVELRARVTHIYPSPDYCNMTAEGIHGADNPAIKATVTINTRAVELVRCDIDSGDKTVGQPIHAT